MYTILPIAATFLTTATSLVVYPEAFTHAPQPIYPAALQSTFSSSSSSSSSSSASFDDTDDTPLPVIIWHGLGDAYNADGLRDVAGLIDTINPGTYTHIIQLGADANADRSASFFGNVTQQVETVCAQLKADPILSTAPAIDAVGFSQGGQFLRAYVQTCNDPPVRNLITFGSQHNGIREFQQCKNAFDLVCQGANALLRGGRVWSDYVQERLVPAQYYRDPADLDSYLEYSHWLADVNNERAVKNGTYAKNLAKLDKFVMVLFEEDKTVIPKESGWFAEVNGTSETVTDLRDRPIYKEDWIGLKALDEKGGLVFEKVKGEHMSLNEKDLTRLFGKYFGPVSNEKSYGYLSAEKDRSFTKVHGAWQQV